MHKPRHMIGFLGILCLIAITGIFAVTVRAMTVTQIGCAGTLPTRLIVRERARVSPTGDDSPLNVRSAAGTNADRIGNIPIGGVFYVLDGYVCTPRYTWYQVAYQGIVGWVAEGDNSVYFTEPYPPLL